ncbi:TBC1 domain family member 1 [Protopterus annectens]|uniref:TBC1 domain family member 1 n=1 Tax=Protopterus annectens TaxID=7888 RepID=UPI001CFA1B5F|nr:TBC1 domain family member 1 [Protopterus annectens]
MKASLPGHMLEEEKEGGNEQKEEKRLQRRVNTVWRLEMAPLFSWMTKVPEIISNIRQAGKTARQEEVRPRLADPDDTFAKKFEVLFCGCVSVAHRKAPPALIDECIEKFNHLCAKKSENAVLEQPGISDSLKTSHSMDNCTLLDGKLHSMKLNPDSSFPSGSATVLFNNDLQDDSSSSASSVDDGTPPQVRKHQRRRHVYVQPTDIEQNRTMLFTVGQTEIYLISPDTKKVAIEKSFKEISFCSQGIRHVDHFGFICRETPENRGCQFVCYVFQCASEALVDEIMMTLKQAFTVAANLQTPKVQVPVCESCPMQRIHKLCERIEGLHPSKTKLELQKHIASLDVKQQTSVFEEVQRKKPKTEQEENEIVMFMLRHLYEEKQKSHVHNEEGKQTSQNCTEKGTGDLQNSATRVKLEQLKSKAKKSLAESLENILSRSNKLKGQQESVDSTDSESMFSNTLNSVSKESLDCDSSSQSPQESPTKTSDSVLEVLKDLDSTSLESPKQGFRRRANTLSDFPTDSEQPLEALVESSPVVHRRLMRYHSVSTDSNVEPPSSHRASSTSVRNRRHSWRQQIFLRVATPPKGCDSTDRSELDLPPRSPLLTVSEDGPGAVERKRSSKELRELWQKAIKQQILLLRMEKENQKLLASENDLLNKRLKLDYEEITPCLKDVTLVWEKMLNAPGRAKVKFDLEEIHAAVGQGVPRHHRGEIWKLLAEQYQLRHPSTSKQPKDTPYKELLKQLTSQQHAILIDLGRTFPTHPYFSTQLGAGQLSLYNLLKAYSLLDPEVGYCQGLSFIAGVLLLHMSEEDAFSMLKFLMYDMGLRKQYRPDMIILQVQMYQLSRLLHDYHRDLYNHLEEYEIGPSLYAAPWFLTAFASQFPLGFVARVFDMLFLQGPEVTFKVALSLLGSHKPLILQHDNLEAIVDFIKSTLPNLGLVQMEKTINQVFEMDISKQLQAYDVEYLVLQEELIDSSPPPNDNTRIEKLEKTNNTLRKQNLNLLEELQAAHAKIRNLETTIENLHSTQANLKQCIRTLELERSALLHTVSELQKNQQCNSQSNSEDKTLTAAKENKDKSDGQ